LILKPLLHKEAELSNNWMAREFFIRSGITPFTINQTDFVSDSDEYLLDKFLNPIRAVIKR